MKASNIAPMKNQNSHVPKALHRRSAILASAILATAPFSLPAATETWNAFFGQSDWSVGANWLDGTAPAALDPTLDLVFPAGPGDSYLSNNNIFNFQLNTLTLNSVSSSQITLLGESLEFLADDTAAAVTQSGSGAFVIENAITASSSITLGGSGTSSVTLNGAISGAGLLDFTGAHWILSNPLNSFSSGMTIRTGARVELAPSFGQLAFPNTAPSLVGGGPLLIDGGTLKLTTLSDMVLGKALDFGSAGGTLDLTNDVGGNISSGDLAISVAAGATGVIQWNGGINGLSSNNQANAEWQVGANTLRLRALTGAGTLRVELSNGGTFRPTSVAGAVDDTVNNPLIIQGTVGGDPTSGPGGLVNTGVDRNSGRVLYDIARVTYAGGLTFEGALQVAQANRTTALNGNITINTGAYVAFQGRGTGTAINGNINTPGTATAGQNHLWIGENASTTFTIKSGGIAVFDSRIRSEQLNANGVLLGGTAVIEGGGRLRIAQSLSNFSGVAPLTTNQNVGDTVFRGNVRGEGSDASEAVLDIRLPQPDPAGTALNGTPAPLIPGTPPAQGSRPFGGFIAEASHQIIINGSGFGGLRVETNARQDRLFSSTGAVGGSPIPDPVSNATKMGAYLTPARLAAITGSGGYLTPAAANATWTFPAGGEWAGGVSVGLRVSNSNVSGTDVVMGPASWGHSLAVDAGATLSTGASAPFNHTAGTLHGKGTVVAAGGISIGAGASVSPGMGDVGTLTINGSLALAGNLLLDITPASADRLVVSGDLTLAGALTLIGTAGFYDIIIASYSGALSGAFSPPPVLPPNFSLDYGTGTNSVIRLAFNSQQLVWDGAPGTAWSTGGGNWKAGATFGNGDRVTFDDTATGSTNVTISGGDVLPGGVVFNHSTKNYTLSGSAGAAVAGPISLEKNGTGELTISGPHSYTGGTVIHAGTVRLGASNSLPSAGAVEVKSGATLLANGFSNLIEKLIVAGTASGAGSLRVASLDLRDGGLVSTPIVLDGAITRTGPGSSLIAGTLDLAGGERTIEVGTTSASQLTISAAISNGGLVKTGEGVLILSSSANSYAGGTSITAGVLQINVAGALPANGNVTLAPDGMLMLGNIAQVVGALTVNGTVNAANTSVSASSLAGNGTISLTGSTFTANQTVFSIYSGAFEGDGMIRKLGPATLAIAGTSGYTGGIDIEEGILRIGSAFAAGFGAVNVKPGGTLSLQAMISNEVNLQGGTIGSTAQTLLGVVNAAADSTVVLFNPENPGVDGDLVLTGNLEGSAGITLEARPGVLSPDLGPGLRLRGTTPSGFSGTITVQQRAKLELQSSVSGPFSPAGTGRILLEGGSFFGAAQGDYSILNLRALGTGDTIFGNDVELVGTGFATLNPIGTAPANSVRRLGNLRIGDGQELGVNKNGVPDFGVAFESVTSTGGTITFRPTTPGFGGSGIGFLELGAISETAPTNVVMDGLSRLVMTGNNTYTGTTAVLNGTLVVTGEIAGATTTIANGTLAGTGRVTDVVLGDNFDPGGTASIAPGSPGQIGTLRTGSVNAAFSDAGFSIQIDSNSLTTDLLEVTGTLTLGNGLAVLSATDLGFATLFAGETFAIATATGGVSGTFFDLPNLSTLMIGASAFEIRYLPNAIHLVAVPEPTALTALTAGAGLLFGLGRLRRRRA
jgi:autotransporter-associated beta strand protein